MAPRIFPSKVVVIAASPTTFFLATFYVARTTGTTETLRQTRVVLCASGLEPGVSAWSWGGQRSELWAGHETKDRGAGALGRR